MNPFTIVDRYKVSTGCSGQTSIGSLKSVLEASKTETLLIYSWEFAPGTEKKCNCNKQKSDVDLCLHKEIFIKSVNIYQMGRGKELYSKFNWQVTFN